MKHRLNLLVWICGLVVALAAAARAEMKHMTPEEMVRAMTIPAAKLQNSLIEMEREECHDQGLDTLRWVSGSVGSNMRQDIVAQAEAVCFSTAVEAVHAIFDELEVGKVSKSRLLRCMDAIGSSTNRNDGPATGRVYTCVHTGS